MKPYSRMLILLIGTIATATVLQGAFDTSDHQKGERAVRLYRVGAGAPLGARVEAEAPGGVWTTEITHGCRGVVRVSYTTQATQYLFDYDVPGHAIHPANPSAEHVLATFPADSPSKP